MLIEGLVTFKNDSKIADMSGGRQGGVVNYKTEVLNEFCEGFGADGYNVRFIRV